MTNSSRSLRALLKPAEVKCHSPAEVRFLQHPLWITDKHQDQYHGRQAARLAKQITKTCQQEITLLLQEGFSKAV
jgi:hypothetical protein